MKPAHVQAALDEMRAASAHAFHACELFGKGSTRHMEAIDLYEAAERHYIVACDFAKVAPYRTYDED